MNTILVWKTYCHFSKCRGRTRNGLRRHFRFFQRSNVCRPDNYRPCRSARPVIRSYSIEPPWPYTLAFGEVCCGVIAFSVGHMLMLWLCSDWYATAETECKVPEEFLMRNCEWCVDVIIHMMEQTRSVGFEFHEWV